MRQSRNAKTNAATQTRKLRSVASVSSFAYPLSASDDARWNGYAKRCGHFEVKSEIENDRLLDWQLGRNGPIECFVDMVHRLLMRRVAVSTYDRFLLCCSSVRNRSFADVLPSRKACPA